ncbi:hypothetical protein PVT68_02015 [Microbulbifer bruguierae]|uniref:Uncharacterized protein n=1 Tax=Microbulbifer bruguierae TaxID=3029061 RepID=A0ABY8NHU1_9GAMM|nr:hypothetical protein [Microbulbifer bruguierae]WGL17088.1 hypothetical protein PVT68_02015 [Microbulbifer bruguierae]
MSIGQKIYQLIEQFAIEPTFWKQFAHAFRDVLVDQGTADHLAQKLATIASEALRLRAGSDYHLGMVEVIALHPEFEHTMYQDIAAASAMHKYMTFCMHLDDLQPASGFTSH